MASLCAREEKSLYHRNTFVAVVTTTGIIYLLGYAMEFLPTLSLSWSEDIVELAKQPKMSAENTEEEMETKLGSLSNL